MGRRLRSSGRIVDGVLLLDKPYGWTSNHAVQRVKRLFNARKVGHTGTLDQRATGVLPLCFGEATKFSKFGLTANKTYAVVAQLGVTTDTGDTDGTVVAEKPVPDLSEADVEKVLTQFRGTIKQVPSMYSALKHDGQRLYKLARRGIEVERPPREITIHRNELVNLANARFELEVDCTKGTYIRTLIADIGDAIGCGAHVVSLIRTRIADFELAACSSFDQLVDAKHDGTLDDRVQPIEIMVNGWIDIKLPHRTAYLVRQGQSVSAPTSTPTSGWVKLYEENADGVSTFIGIGEITGSFIAPRRLVASTPSQFH